MAKTSRIYGEIVDIDTSKTIEFYNQRVRNMDSRKEKYTTVLLGDQDPDKAVKWDAFEKPFILPKLKLDDSKNVLDLGCGIGRWAETVAPLCNHYTGIDFSEEMIEYSKNKINRDNCTFINKAIIDSFSDENLLKYKYDAVIFTSVAMYINDDVLVQCYSKLCNIVNRNAIIYFEESAGVGERLTLNHIWSENLNSYYEAIYRTDQEYLNLMSVLLEKCEILESGFLRELDTKEQQDTSHWYVILRYNPE